MGHGRGAVHRWWTRARSLPAALHLTAVVVSMVAASAVLAGCSSAMDQAATVQTHLNRLDGVVESAVTTPSREQGARIDITFDGSPTVRDLTRLVHAVEGVADEEDYPSHLLTLAAVGTEDRLTVDDSFAGSSTEPAVLEGWLATTAALLGPVDQRFETTGESIAVDSGGAIGHDVGEAQRIGYGFADTTWTFTDPRSTFVAVGRVSPTDVALFEGVQRSVSSEVLPARAPSWRLERYPDHLQLDLDVDLPATIAPDRITAAKLGTTVQPLALAALAAVRPATLPGTLRLIHHTGTADDVFGYWSSDRPTAPGRDPLGRGWDAWLRALASAPR